ncbi:unnamed protein product [Pieris macdunnoughi]|uniref:Major facilitator superfamily (MFS) profile domain-containing protein n=1 Tax=Pieris macdunnoughi TaxID=345717 RepID=A0A821UWB6_9NEOP|nr:unnamed protein product [Pieris macdunnoughi]
MDYVSSSEIKEVENKPKTIEDVNVALESVIQHAGEMGLYQKLLFFAMFPFAIMWTFVYFGHMYLTLTPEHWCKVPELEGLEAELRRSLSIPMNSAGSYERCRMFDANWTQVLETLQPPDEGTPLILCNNGWEFLFNVIPYETIATEREWVCNKASYIPIVTTFGFAGTLLGVMTLGVLADYFGRVPLIIVANLCGFLGGVGTLFTTGFWDYAICRFIVGLSNNQCFMLMYILVLEYVGSSHRTLVANMSIALFFGSGCLVLPWLAYGIADWRILQIVMVTPIVAVIAVPFLLPESARWLSTTGKVDKALKMIRRVEKVNKKEIPQDVIDHFMEVSKEKPASEAGVLEFIKTPELRLTSVLLIVAIMSTTLTFDTVLRMSENIGLNVFITFTISAATEVPSTSLLVFLLDRFGRRWLVFCPTIATIVLNMTNAFVTNNLASGALLVSARFFNIMAYNTLIQWTPELLPTSMRASGGALIFTCGNLTLLLSSFVVFSAQYWQGLPFLIISVFAVLAASCALFIPETKGKPMP